MSAVAEICNHLNLTDPLKHSTCIGYSQRSPDCHNSVAHLSRLQATAVLKAIARRWKSSDNVDDELDRLASLLLCKRNHQLQAGGKVEEWKRMLKRAAKRADKAEASQAQQSSSLASSSRSATRIVVSETNSRRKKGDVKSLTNKELLGELRRRLFDNADESLLDDFLDLAHEVRDATETEAESEEQGGSEEDDDYDFDGSDDTDEDGDDSDYHQHEQTAARTQGRTMDQHPTSVSAVARKKDRPSAEGLRQARIAALSDSVVSNTAPTSAQPPPPLRQSHVECGICLEPYPNNRENDYWECQQCLNRVCLKCFGDCCASAAGHQEARCAYCRAEA